LGVGTLHNPAKDQRYDREPSMSVTSWFEIKY